MPWWLALINTIMGAGAAGFAVAAVIRPRLLAPSDSANRDDRFYPEMYAARSAPLGALVVVHLVQRETGIRFRSLGARANWMVAAIVVACLALFSVSLSLVSLQLPWAVVATSLVAFAITTCLSGLALRSAVERAGRD